MKTAYLLWEKKRRKKSKQGLTYGIIMMRLLSDNTWRSTWSSSQDEAGSWASLTEGKAKLSSLFLLSPFYFLPSLFKDRILSSFFLSLLFIKRTALSRYLSTLCTAHHLFDSAELALEQFLLQPNTLRELKRSFPHPVTSSIHRKAWAPVGAAARPKGSHAASAQKMGWRSSESPGFVAWR